MTATDVALLEPYELAELGPPEAVRLPLDLLDPSASNPRRALTDVEELADSISDPKYKYGLLQPILVRRMGERYEVLAGHRRLAAFQLLRTREPYNDQWRTIPSVVRSMDNDEDAYLALLLAQVQIRPWRPREEAAALERLAETHTLKQIGDMLHRGEPWASRRLRVYADAVLSGYVQTGKLATTVAEELLLVPEASARREYAEQAIEEGWSQLQARNEVRKLKLSKQIREVAKRARELLEILSQVDVQQLPPSATRDLWTLRGRIDAIGRGPTIPSIEQAERAAHVDQTKAPRRRTRLRIE